MPLNNWESLAVRMLYGRYVRWQEDNSEEAALNALVDPVRSAALSLAAGAAAASHEARKTMRQQLRSMGATPHGAHADA